MFISSKGEVSNSVSTEYNKKKIRGKRWLLFTKLKIQKMYYIWAQTTIKECFNDLNLLY